MCEEAKVSIVVPVYNVEKYLDACLWSLRKQTYMDIEIIVVDDCSSDQSMNIAKEHSSEDERIKLCLHEKNKGPGAARNTGIRAASGKYIMFLDSDDMYSLDAVYCMVKAIEKNKANMVIARMGWLKNGIITPVKYVDIMIKSYELYCQNNLRNIDASKWFLGTACNRIYNLEWIKNNRIYFDEGVYWEDVCFTVQCWYSAKIITSISEYIYLRTEREDNGNLSITQDYGKKKYLDRDYLQESLFRVFENECKGDEVTKQDTEIILKRIFSTTQSIMGYCNPDIREWAEEWFEEHKVRYEAILERLESL